jgi:hypothetical protein
MHGNGLNDPGKVPSSPNNSIIIDPGGQGFVSKDEEFISNSLAKTVANSALSLTGSFSSHFVQQKLQ